MKSLSLTEIMDAFDPIDRPDVVAPALAWVPWADLDYFAWKHPTEPKGYLVAALPERHIGLVLKMMTSARTGMCDLCHCVDRTDGATLVTVHGWAHPRTSHGIHLCANLDCSDSARGIKWVYRMGETIPVGRRIERLQENVERFVRSVTGLKAAAKPA